MLRAVSESKRRSNPANHQKVLVVAAFAPELAALRRALRRAISPENVVLATVGVGLVESALGARAALDKHQPDAVILVGTCGRLPGSRIDPSKGPPRNVPAPGSGAIAAASLHLAQGIPAGSFLPSPMPSSLQASKRLTRELARDSAVCAVDVVCPLAITAARAAARTLAQTSGAAVENLEAFAVARAARTARVPFASVLGVANEVGPKGHEEWLKHGAKAATFACDTVARWLTSN